MVYQETMTDRASRREGNGRHPDPPGVTSGVGEFIHDVICLAELQGQLLTTDLQEGKSRAIAPLAMLVAAPLLLLGTIPVLLMGFAWLLHTAAGWTVAAALLTVAGVGFVAAGAIGWIGWKRLTGAMSVMTRSRKEFRENMRWLKGALKPNS